MGKAKAVLDGNDLSLLNKVPFYIFLRLDLFHLSGPQGMVGPTPATTVGWFTAYNKKSPVEKLKALEALITPLITEMPEVEGVAEEEESPEALLAAKTLKASFDEVKTTPGAEDEPPFAQAQARPSTPVAPAKPKLFVVAKPAKAPVAKVRKPRSPKHLASSSSDDDSSSSDTDSSIDIGTDEEAKKHKKKEKKKAKKAKKAEKKKMKQTTLKDKLVEQGSFWASKPGSLGPRPPPTSQSSSSSSSSSSGKTKKKSELKVPKEEDGDESPTKKTPKAKKRKKGESTFALTSMTVLADEPICDNVMALKAWRKLHFVGKHDIGPEEIKDPADAWKARDFNEDHTATLMKSFQEHQKMNAKGLRLVLQHQAYWDMFEGMDEDQKNVAAELESDFYADLRAVGQFKPFTGDHSRRAASLLKAKYKQNPKWQMFRGVKVYLCAPGGESDDMLLQLGNINNTIQQIHRKLEFADKIKQMHLL
jgi:hypothetical protein